MAGELVTLKVVGEDTNGAFLLGEEVSPPGGGPPPHIHHREDEMFCVLEGEYEFLVGERIRLTMCRTFARIRVRALTKATEAKKEAAVWWIPTRKSWLPVPLAASVVSNRSND